MSSASLIAVTWCIAEVCPVDTLTRDLIELSSNLSMVAYVISEPVAWLNVDSNLTLLSVSGGCPGDKNLCVPIPAVVVPKPTILDLESKRGVLSFSICNLTKLFSNLAVITPTVLFVIPLTSSE